MSCTICGHDTKLVISLPDFIGGDQALLQCADCGHGQLGVQHPQEGGYLSGSTEYSRRGIEWFLSHIPQRFDCALDFGCNDGFLLSGIKAHKRIGVDKDVLAPYGFEIQVHPSLATVDARPDLIVSRHTLEHLPDPLGTLRELVAKAAPHAQVVIEVPCLDALAESFRFDQIYNDHLQYFTVGSFHKMLRAAGLRVVAFARQPVSMLALCVKGKEQDEQFPVPTLEKHYRAFKTRELAIGAIVAMSKRRLAYGASAIFPVLLYHLGLPASAFEAVLDDATAKHGTTFHGLPVRAPDDLTDATVLITAPDSFGPIYRKLGSAKHVLSAVPML